MRKVAHSVPDARLGLRWLSFALAAAALLLVLSSGWLPCPMQQMFAHACPTCGMTRALALMLRGHLTASLAAQPLALPTFACSWLLLAFGLEGVLRGTSALTLWRQHCGLLGAATSVFLMAFALWLVRSFT
jgi:multisubunit Na+/H+ antiporter MnhB subunit